MPITDLSSWGEGEGGFLHGGGGIWQRRQTSSYGQEMDLDREQRQEAAPTKGAENRPGLEEGKGGYYSYTAGQERVERVLEEVSNKEV